MVFNGNTEILNPPILNPSFTLEFLFMQLLIFLFLSQFDLELSIPY